MPNPIHSYTTVILESTAHGDGAQSPENQRRAQPKTQRKRKNKGEFCFFVSLALLTLTTAHSAPLALHNGTSYPPSLNLLADKAAEIQSISVNVEGNQKTAASWEMTSTHAVVFLSKLTDLPMIEPTAGDDLWRKVPAPEKSYKGLTVHITLTGGDSIQTLRVFQGKVTDLSGKLIAQDPGRRLEYWLFSTARIKKEQVLGAHVLPILSFDQCRLLGSTIVETTPRQCMLVEGDIYLESNEHPDPQALKAYNFDSCLRYGKALIYTFPRRCMIKGGRVFTEPPSIKELPADAPLATTTQPMGNTPALGNTDPSNTFTLENLGLQSPTVPMLPPISSTAAGLSPTSPIPAPTTVSLTGLGTYTVSSPTTPTSPSLFQGTSSFKWPKFLKPKQPSPTEGL